MSKKKKRIEDKKDLDISIDTKNVDIDIDRKDGKFTANVDTKNVDFNIEKTDTSLKVEVQSEKKFWHWIGKLLSKIGRRKRK